MTAVHEAFTIPLYTVAEAARMLRVPSQTLAGWARGYDYRLRSGELRHSEPLVTDYGSAPRHTPTMPFVGLAEASFLAAVREAGVPMQRIRPALAEIKLRMGIDHALASRALLTDGDEILIDLSRSGEVDVAPLMQLEVVRNRQGVLGPVMEKFARHITYGPSGYAGAINLPQFGSVVVAVDPEIAFGRPHLATSGVEVDAVMDRFSAGDAIPALADDFQLTDREIEELLRAELRPIGG